MNLLPAVHAAADCIWCWEHSIVITEFLAVFLNTLMQYWKKRSGISEMKVHAENATATSNLQPCLQLKESVCKKLPEPKGHCDVGCLLQKQTTWQHSLCLHPWNKRVLPLPQLPYRVLAVKHCSDTLPHWPTPAHNPCCCLLLTGVSCGIWHWLVPDLNHRPLKMNYGSEEIQERHWDEKICICENSKVTQKSFCLHTLRMEAHPLHKK